MFIIIIVKAVVIVFKQRDQLYMLINVYILVVNLLTWLSLLVRYTIRRIHHIYLCVYLYLNNKKFCFTTFLAGQDKNFLINKFSKWPLIATQNCVCFRNVPLHSIGEMLIFFLVYLCTTSFRRVECLDKNRRPRIRAHARTRRYW